MLQFLVGLIVLLSYYLVVLGVSFLVRKLFPKFLPLDLDSTLDVFVLAPLLTTIIIFFAAFMLFIIGILIFILGGAVLH